MKKITHRTGRYRLYPNKKQERILLDHCKASLLVQNKCIELAKADQKLDVKPDFGKYQRNFKLWRGDGIGFEDERYFDENGENWAVDLLRKTQARALYYVPQRIKANFFTKGGGSRLGFRRLKDASSFQTDQMKLVVNEDNPKKSHLELSNPQEKGMLIKIKLHHLYEDRILKSLVITHQASQWHACMIFEGDTVPDPQPINENSCTVGLDCGVKDHLIDNLNNTHNIELDRKLEARIQRVQQKLSRCKRGSNNRKKIKERLGKLKAKQARKNNYQRHHITKSLVENNDGIAIEDFKSKQIVTKLSSDRSKLKKQRSSTNKKLLLGAPHEIINQLAYKCEDKGKIFKKIPARNTTRTCSECGHIQEGLSLSDREWDCGGCSHHHFRDQNAAQNIRKAAFGD